MHDVAPGPSPGSALGDPLCSPDLGVRPPGQPLPDVLATHGGPLAEQFSRWLRQRDDPAQAGQKQAVVRALAAVSGDDVRREARQQAAWAAEGGWDHWVWAVPAATVAGLLGLPMQGLQAQRHLVTRLRAVAAGLAPAATVPALRQADEAVQALLDALRMAEARAPDAPLPWTLLHHAGPGAWPDRATREANRLALLWQSHEAGAALLSHGLLALVQTGAAPDRTALGRIAADGGGVRLTRRFALRDTVMDGQAVAKGAEVVVPLVRAEAGPGQSPSREDDLAFGAGAHRCPGQSLALASLEAALDWAATQRQWALPAGTTPRRMRLPNLDILLFDTQPTHPEVPA